ncbi:ABC transporter ATP-binding protein [Brachybacterium paraconglomeratum]|uniref:ABC transporter ATP-binding protein n=1 Tax=Brachybacterium paraconglomeratum TaxID=173362 RepID=UPI0022E01D33|nr:ATP-binding cassette domain-containing protein [Brachybacterium paraconglomeratum]
MTSTTATAPTLEVCALSKRYGARAAVDALSFSCSPGTVTGFLGPNGAGKSTTLRILTGLAEADEGMALIGGRRYRTLEHPARTVGVMLDARALHGGRTGIETLRLTARTLGMPRDRAEEVLETVGLEHAATKRVGGYSYGMRQRLGIGVALMGDPSVLVLDEPANGLDPEGIRWMRRLLRSFADAGGTVLLSSHQLREVEATVDRLVVISEGRLVREGPLEELTAVTGTRVAALDQAALRRALDAHGIAFELRAGGELAVSLAPEDMGRLALREQLVLTSLGAGAGTGLEEVFFALTGHDEPSADEPAPAL